MFCCCCRGVDALAVLAAVGEEATPLEEALVQSQSSRTDTSLSQHDRNVAYAAVMGDVLHRFPDDPDVAALFALAVMNQRPWSLCVSLDCRDSVHLCILLHVDCNPPTRSLMHIHMCVSSLAHVCLPCVAANVY